MVEKIRFQVLRHLASIACDFSAETGNVGRGGGGKKRGGKKRKGKKGVRAHLRAPFDSISSYPSFRAVCSRGDREVDRKGRERKKKEGKNKERNDTLVFNRL